MATEEKKYHFIFSSNQTLSTPIFKEDKRKQWISFGEDDDYPNYLLSNYNKAPIHNAICNGKINYIVGSGLKVAEYLKVQDLAMAKGIIMSANEYEDADDLNRKLATDLVLFGGFYSQVIQNKAKDPKEYYHLPFQNLRRDKTDENIWYYTKDWKTRNPLLNDDFATFHEFDGTFESGKKYLVSYKSYRAGNDTYALPDYISSNAVIESEWRVDNFLRNNIMNGFSAGFIINFLNGVPEPDEQAELERQIKAKFAGDNNGGSFILNFSKGKDQAAEVIPIPTNGHDDRFATLSQWIADKLIIAHNIPNAALFGIQVAGKLGGSQELPIASFIFQNHYVNNKQIILEKFWNDVLKARKIQAKFTIIEVPQFREPISNETLVNVLTQNEIRELAGFEPIKEVKQFTKFSVDESLVSMFSNDFIKDSDFTEIYQNDVHIHTFAEAKKFEDDINFNNKVLGLIKANPSNQAEQLAEALDVSKKKIMAAIETLAKQGLIKLPEGVIEITKKGEAASVEEDLIIVYKYALRPDAPSLVDGGTSRPFCVQLMELSKSRSWTLLQIQNMNNGQDLDVFAHRGGWYTKKGTDLHVPFCRHRWEQRLVKVKRK